MNKFTPQPYYYHILSKLLVYIYLVTFFLNNVLLVYCTSECECLWVLLLLSLFSHSVQTHADCYTVKLHLHNLIEYFYGTCLLCGSIYVYDSCWSGIILIFVSHWNWVWITEGCAEMTKCIFVVSTVWYYFQFTYKQTICLNRFVKTNMPSFGLRKCFCYNARLMPMYK